MEGVLEGPAVDCLDSAGVSPETDDTAVVPLMDGDAGAGFVLAEVFGFPVGLAVGTGSVDVEAVAFGAGLAAGRPQAGLEGGAVVRDVEAAACDLPLSLLDLVTDDDKAAEAGVEDDPFFPFVPPPAPTCADAFFSD